jgi:hypothetical protein
MAPMKLTRKQARFVEEYLADLNAAQAAIRAGYSAKTARVIGHENLTKPDIAAAIEKARAERAERAKLPATCGLADGVRENAQSWKGLLLDLKRRGLVIGPELAIAKPAPAKAGGALGFWQAIEEVWPKTRGQRCWLHKTAKVLNRLPKSQQSKAKRALQDVWMAETRNDANAAFDAFVETYAIKYDKAVGCLTKDREALLAFYDFPAEHWKHCGPPTPLKAHSPPCGIEPCAPRDVSQTGRRSPWFSSLHRPLRKAGAVSTATAS